MDYDLYLSFPDDVLNPKPALSRRDKLLLESGLSLLQNRDFWTRNSIELSDAEWDIIEAGIAETAERIG